MIDNIILGLITLAVLVLIAWLLIWTAGKIGSLLELLLYGIAKTVSKGWHEGKRRGDQ
jgi:hypothetical protein